MGPETVRYLGGWELVLQVGCEVGQTLVLFAAVDEHLVLSKTTCPHHRQAGWGSSGVEWQCDGVSVRCGWDISEVGR